MSTLGSFCICAYRYVRPRRGKAVDVVVLVQYKDKLMWQTRPLQKLIHLHCSSSRPVLAANVVFKDSSVLFSINLMPLLCSRAPLAGPIYDQIFPLGLSGSTPEVAQNLMNCRRKSSAKSVAMWGSVTKLCPANQNAVKWSRDLNVCFCFTSATLISLKAAQSLLPGSLALRRRDDIIRWWGGLGARRLNWITVHQACTAPARCLLHWCYKW